MVYSRLNFFSLDFVFVRGPLIVILLFFLFIQRLFGQSSDASKVFDGVVGSLVVLYGYDYDNTIIKQGSGVILNDKCHIITNYHLVNGCYRIELKHKDIFYPLKGILGIDVKKDIAVLETSIKNSPKIKIGSAKRIQIGQRIYAIGSPLGFENTISEGIVSGFREFEGTGINHLQITASISHGSSGGAIVNQSGELLGISSSSASGGQNLNFAIPINIVLDLYKEWVKRKNKGLDFLLKVENLILNEKFYEAIEYVTMFLSNHHNDWEIYTKSGYLKSMVKDYEGAILDFNVSIRLNPNDYDTFLKRAACKFALNDNLGTIQDLNKAIDLNPNVFLAYETRAMAKADRNDFIGAINDYSKAISINPKESRIYQNRGIAKLRLEKYHAALEDFNLALELDKTNPAIYLSRGGCKFNMADYNGALEDFTKAIEIDTNCSEAYLKRGLAQYSLGNKMKGCLDLTKAKELRNSTADELLNQLCY
ncbi:MAG: trypsin-like peptidase domain-containing protein [Ignavibacteriales bacterium]|nr:MAG: trypsin-like peptidase domain-containing protein [Ignavibacteriales bacterium]